MTDQHDDQPTPLADELAPTVHTPDPPGGAPPAGEVATVLGGAFANRYRLGAPIARGGIGQVVSAEDVALHREVAVKELLDDRHPSSRVRFEREALLTARLEHPGIVSVHEFGRRPGGAQYLVLRKVHGRPFSQAIAEAGKVEERLALLPTLIAVADAVGYAHSQGVVHRDLKPSNVLLGQHGETVVIDWGLAKDLRAAEPPLPAGEREALATPAGDAKDSGAGLTLAGSLLGTPEYMSPEQAAGRPADERSDVYALGVMLYHALAGAPPYQGPSALAVLQAVQQGPPRPLAARERRLPPDLVAIVDRAMAREPSRRYANAAELAADLRRFQNGRLVLAHSYSVPARLARWAKRHRALLAVGAVAAALLAVVGAVSVRRVLEERDRANREAEASKRVAKFLSNVFTLADPLQSNGRSVTARELLDRAAKDVDRGLEKDPLVRAQLSVAMGDAYASLGLREQARPLLQAAVETRERLLGPDARQTLAARADLGAALGPREAEPLDRETLERCRRTLGSDDPLTLTAANALGNALSGLARYEEAEALLRENLERHRKASGPRSLEAAGALSNLGTAVSRQKRYPEAIALHGEALSIFEEQTGPDSANTLRALVNLGSDEWAAGQAEQALAHQLAASQGMARIFGPDHPATLQHLSNLANSYSALGRFDEAAKTLREVVAAARKRKDKETLVLSLYNLACVAAKQGQEDAAREALVEAAGVGLPPPVAQALPDDTDLASLHGKAWFDALVAEVKQRQPRAP